MSDKNKIYCSFCGRDVELPLAMCLLNWGMPRHDAINRTGASVFGEQHAQGLPHVGESVNPDNEEVDEEVACTS